MVAEIVQQVDWREIPGCPGYRAGSNGEIQSSRNTRGVRPRPWRTIATRTNPKNGYKYVTIRVNLKHYTATVHSLVLRAFAGDRPTGCDACHNNGDRCDNRILNLRWGTRTENNHDKDSHGTNICGEDHPISKLTDEVVLQMRRMKTSGKSYQAIADSVGVTITTAWSAIRGATWKHLPEAYQQ